MGQACIVRIKEHPGGRGHPGGTKEGNEDSAGHTAWRYCRAACPTVPLGILSVHGGGTLVKIWRIE